MYTAYVLDDESRKRLVAKFPPHYDNFVGHHVTVNFNVPKGTEAPVPAIIRVIGHVDSDDGLEALVVSVNGERTRDDGKMYHITWSIDSKSDYTPKDSNKLLQTKRYTVTLPVDIDTIPSVLE